MVQAKTDIKTLDGSQRRQVLKAVSEASANHLSFNESDYGKPLANKSENNLTGYLKIKLIQLGIRVVYKIIRQQDIMKVNLISVRDYNAIYQVEVHRIGIDKTESN